MPCIFCEIARGNSPAEVLYQNEHAIAILDINPIHYGHALVMPKGHFVTYNDLSDEALRDIMLAMKKVSGAIVASLQPAGFNIFSNNGKAAGQSVFHFHFHITPRYEDDNIQFVLELKRYGGEDLSTYAGKLRAQIESGIVNQEST